MIGGLNSVYIAEAVVICCIPLLILWFTRRR